MDYDRDRAMPYRLCREQAGERRYMQAEEMMPGYGMPQREWYDSQRRENVPSWERSTEPQERRMPDNRIQSMQEDWREQPPSTMQRRMEGEQPPQRMPLTREGELPGWQMPPDAVPYRRMPDMSEMLDDEQASELDLRRLQAMFPQAAQMLLPFIEEECDKLEYEGSPMFDERPDQETVRRIAQSVFDLVRDQFPEEPEMVPDEVLSMQMRGDRRRPGQNWLQDMIQTMLLQEMHRRRCRHGRCRRWFR